MGLLKTEKTFITVLIPPNFCQFSVILKHGEKKNPYTYHGTFLLSVAHVYTMLTLLSRIQHTANLKKLSIFVVEGGAVVKERVERHLRSM